MAYPLIQFVASPTVGATVLLDMNPGTSGVVSDGFSIGAPQLEGTPSAPGRQFGFRRLTMTQEVVGNRSAAHALVADLGRELVRPSSWLLFQQTSLSKPMWFRTWMTQQGEIDFSEVRAAKTADDARTSRYYISVQIDADPWAYGVRVALSAITMGNNPASGTNPTVYTLPTILGDAPAPLRIQVDGDFRANTALVSVMASDVAPTGALVANVSAMGTDTTSVSNAGAIGGTTHSISFATPTLAPRLTYSGGAGIRHGSYKALLRVAAGAGATFTAQLRLFGATAALAEKTFTATNANWFYVDLGEFDWPAGGRIDGGDFLTTNASTLAMQLWMSRQAGGAPYVDALVLIPTEIDGDVADTLITTFPSADYVPFASVIDGESETVRILYSANFPYYATAPASCRGGFPYVTPGKVNVLRYMRTLAGGSGDSISAVAALTMSYTPRWLWLADV